MSLRWLRIWPLVVAICLPMTAYSSSYMKCGRLNGAQLNFAVANITVFLLYLYLAVQKYPPFHIITLTPEGNYTNTGAGTEYMAWLERKLNFTLSFYYIPNDKTKAKYGTKNVMAIVSNLLEDNEIDGASVAIILNAESKEKMDLAYYLWTEPFTLIVPRPGEKSRLLAFVYPFDLTVWGLFFITMHVMVALMTLFARIYSKFSINGRDDIFVTIGGRTVWDRSTYYAMYIINIATNQGNTVHGSRLSFRILVGVWVLVATVLVYSYSSTVVSHLTIVIAEPHINSLEDLAASKNVGILLLADFLPPQILDAKFGAIKNLGDQIRQNPDRLLKSMQNVYPLLETGNYAIPILATICKNYVASQFKKEQKCRFLVSDPVTSATYWSLPFQKNSKYTWAFHYALIELWETGLPHHWVGNFLPQAPKCFAKRNQKENSVRRGAIRLDDLTSAFFILGLGFGLATLAFVLEKIIYFTSRRKTAQQDSSDS